MEVIRTAQLDERRKTRESEFMGEYWKLRKAYGTPEDNPKYWESLIQNTNYLIQKYGKNDDGTENHYLESMVLNLIHDLEARRQFRNNYAASLKCFNQMRAGSGLPPVVEVKQ